MIRFRWFITLVVLGCVAGQSCDMSQVPAPVVSDPYDDPSDDEVLSSTPTPPPSVGGPAELSIAGSASQGLLISWADRSSGRSSFVVERSTPTTGWQDYASVLPGGTSYLDRSIAGGSTYCYRVRGLAEGTISGYTQSLCATLPASSSGGTVPPPVLIGPPGSVGVPGGEAPPVTTPTEPLPGEPVDGEPLPGEPLPGEPVVDPPPGTVEEPGPGDPVNCIVRCASDRPYRAFPSAEGFGAGAVGGRGGRVLYVTRLDDYNWRFGEAVIPGTLRWAVEDSTGPRTIMFAVGGTIRLGHDLRFSGTKGSYVTVAGQSAPGGGIAIRDFGLLVEGGAHDVVIRYLRVRPGYTSDSDYDKGAMTVWGTAGQLTHDVILDHNSFTWITDDNGIWGNTERVTLQYNIIAEGSTLPYTEPGYPSGTIHSTGLLAGGAESTNSSVYLSMHHNLIMNNQIRNPQFGQHGGVVDFVNNVIYNWGSYATTIYPETGAATPRMNIIGNRFVRGPGYMVGVDRRPVDVYRADDATIYVRDNLGPHRTSASQDDWEVVGPRSDPVSRAPLSMRRSSAWPTSGAGVPVTAEPAAGLVAALSANVGATAPQLDTVDARLINELLTGTGDCGFGTSVNALEPYPFLASGTSPADSDGDGMPDAWEVEQELDPLNPADGRTDLDGDGYTNLEEYLNSLVGEF